MSRRSRALAGLGLLAVAVLSLRHPALGAGALAAAGLALLALALPRRRRSAPARRPAGGGTAQGRPARILVPVDFSAESAAALAYARALAGRFGSRIFVLHVLPPPSSLLGRPSAEALRERRWRARVAMQGFLRAEGQGAGCQAVFASGAPAAAVLEEADRLGADLIVLGRRGSGGVEGSILGHTAAEIVRRASVPVLTVSELPAAREGLRPPARAAA